MYTCTYVASMSVLSWFDFHSSQGSTVCGQLFFQLVVERKRKTNQNKQWKEKHATCKPKKNLHKLLVFELQASHLTALQLTVVLPLFFFFCFAVARRKKTSVLPCFCPCPAVRRLKQEAKEMREPTEFYSAQPLKVKYSRPHEFPLHKSTLTCTWITIVKRCGASTLFQSDYTSGIYGPRCCMYLASNAMWNAKYLQAHTCNPIGYHNFCFPVLVASLG